MHSLPVCGAAALYVRGASHAVCHLTTAFIIAAVAHVPLVCWAHQMLPAAAAAAAAAASGAAMARSRAQSCCRLHRRQRRRCCADSARGHGDLQKQPPPLPLPSPPLGGMKDYVSSI
eukprot:TRINITY_DN3946_c0_g1_i2.p2 TRINITY_DN3946_c0_g1~~TRINITY_DN3946_c0_g1_i2.p2  ORF type:complete len:117 (-),score=19.36 TRINITY_DN3946_c0_g1_i2:479-829(-)